MIVPIHLHDIFLCLVPQIALTGFSVPLPELPLSPFVKHRNPGRFLIKRDQLDIQPHPKVFCSFSLNFLL